MRYDNIEIGTSDYATQIQTGDGNGISVDAVKVYLDRLPDRPDWHKVNVAIGMTPGEVEVFYVDPGMTEDKPQWVRGCNMVGTPHPTIKERYPEIIKTATVECITISQLFERFDVTEVGFLKIDTEGMDYGIIKDYLDKGLPLPDKLMYESNELMRDEHREKLRNDLSDYYTISEKRYNTICLAK